uniref:Thioredoxin-like fold domain-containing protein n=1 Tax=viral metagenome TaxID=1070528 RepID=A0A6C0DZ06_9ZZZZ
MFIRVFYSVKCSECMNLLQVITNENIIKMFIPVCLDNFTSSQISTLSIKEIPAIVISNNNTPPIIYEGPQQCSTWLNSFIVNRRKNLIQQTEANRKNIQQAQNELRKNEEGAIEYNENEMEGISDSYSYNNVDLAQPKNFVMVGNEDKQHIVTVNENESKFSKNELRAKMSDLNIQRNIDTKEYSQFMEQSQIQKIVNNLN